MTSPLTATPHASATSSWLSRLGKQVKQDSLLQAGASLAFFAMLSLFPLLIFLLSAVAHVPIQGLESAIMGFFNDLLPKEGARLIEGTVKHVVHSKGPNLLSFGIIGTTWFASIAMHSAMVQIDKTMGLQTPRPFLKARLVSVGLTFVLGLVALGAIALIVLGGRLQTMLIQAVGFETGVLTLFVVVRWGIILGALLLGFALIYHLGAAARARFAWVSPGALVGVGTLVLASLSFRFYVRNYANYQVIYGALGTVIVLMLWLYVCALALLLGAEVNAVARTSGALPSSLASRGHAALPHFTTR